MAVETFYAESWPGGRAPAEFWIRRMENSSAYASHAWLWVPDELATGGAMSNLWSMSIVPIVAAREPEGGFALAAMREAIRMARDLEHERDMALAALRMLDELYAPAVTA